jgi:hypothetical protein
MVAVTAAKNWDDHVVPTEELARGPGSKTCATESSTSLLPRRVDGR